MASSTVSIQQNANFTVGLAWDQTSTKPADLDLACVALGPTGLIVDASFFNNPHALSGALIHSGDQKSGVSAGIDEFITVTSSQIPPHVYALIFCLMQPGSADLHACQSAQLHVWTPETQAALMTPVALGSAVPIGCTFSVLGISRRQYSGTWAFDTVLYPFAPPAKNFMDVLPSLMALVNIDPNLAVEMQKSQPTFQLTKENHWTLPVGLTKIAAGLGWDSKCDVDGSCVGLDEKGSCVFNVCFSNRSDLGGIIYHSGDNRTGDGAGDDEVIRIDIASMPLKVDSIFFTVNVFSGGNFTDVKGEYLRVFDDTQGPNYLKELVRFNSLDNGKARGVILVGLYRNHKFPSQWFVSAPAVGSSAHTSSGMIDDCKKVQKAFRDGNVANLGPRMTFKITLVGAHNLPAMDSNGTSDPFVTVFNDKKDQLYKTKVHKKTLNPVWKETFTVETFVGKKLTFKVYDYDLIGSNDKIGKVKDWAIPEVGMAPVETQLNIVGKKGLVTGTLSIVIERKA